MSPRFGMAVLSSLVLLLSSLPAAAQNVCDGVGVACTLEDLGNNIFRYTFQVTNGSPQPIAIFKWGVDPPNIPSEWETVSFDLPADWSGSHPDHHLAFQTPNGDLRPHRIFSPSVAACGDSPTLTFRWTFDRTKGPMPGCFGNLDYTLHYGPIDPTTCLNNGPTLICPGTVPVEPLTWGRIKSVYR